MMMLMPSFLRSSCISSRICAWMVTSLSLIHIYPNGEGYPTIEYSTNDSGYHVPLAEYLQQAWSDLGITLTISKICLLYTSECFSGMDDGVCATARCHRFIIRFSVRVPRTDVCYV